MNDLRSWEESIEHFRGVHGTIITVGPVDSGKTTWIGSCIRDQNRGSIALVSCDLGQVTFGAPGLLSAARCDPSTDHISGLRPERMYFVGQTQPAGRFLQTIHGATLLAAWTRRKADTVLIDTDGYVAGPAAREYKRTLLSLLSPCTAVFFGDHPDLAPLRRWGRSMADIEVYGVKTPSSIQPKTAEQRQRYRNTRLLAWFREAQTYTLSLKSNLIMSGLTSVGRPVPEEEFRQIQGLLRVDPLWVEKNSTRLAVLTSGEVASEDAVRLRREYGDHRVLIRPGSYWEGRLVGDYGETGFSSGMGYITGWKNSPPRMIIRGRFFREPGNTWLIGQNSFHGIMG